MAVTLRDLVPTGPSIGLMADLSGYEIQKFVLAQGAYGFQVDNTRMKPAYLITLTNNKKFRKNLSKIWVGSTQIHIRNPDYKGIEIPVPNFDLLCKYQAIADKTRSSIKRLELSENDSQLAFKVLSQKAFAGEL
jgi:type I restriction enzyme, S subunit